MIQTQFQTKIQVLKTDNAKEYFKSVLGSYLMSQWIVHLSFCVDTPQQNGIAERKNWHLLEVARSLMFSTHVPKHFLGEAVLTATYLINRMPSRILKFKTPCQSLLQIFPHTKIISSLDPKIFGCLAFVHIHQQHHSKLDPKSIKCTFIGYSSHQKGIQLYGCDIFWTSGLLPQNRHARGEHESISILGDTWSWGHPTITSSYFSANCQLTTKGH